MHSIRCLPPEVINLNVTVHAYEKVVLTTSHDSDVAQDAGPFVKHQAIGDGAGLLTQVTCCQSLEKLQCAVAGDLDAFQGCDIEQADAFPNRAGLSTDDR